MVIENEIRNFKNGAELKHKRIVDEDGYTIGYTTKMEFTFIHDSGTYLVYVKNRTGSLCEGIYFIRDNLASKTRFKRITQSKKANIELYCLVNI